MTNSEEVEELMNRLATDMHLAMSPTGARRIAEWIVFESGYIKKPLPSKGINNPCTHFSNTSFISPKGVYCYECDSCGYMRCENSIESKGMVEKECQIGKPVNGCKGCPDCMGIVGKEWEDAPKEGCNQCNNPKQKGIHTCGKDKGYSEYVDKEGAGEEEIKSILSFLLEEAPKDFLGRGASIHRAYLKIAKLSAKSELVPLDEKEVHDVLFDHWNVSRTSAARAIVSKFGTKPSVPTVEEIEQSIKNNVNHIWFDKGEEVNEYRFSMKYLPVVAQAIHRLLENGGK
jgi:hypothetical protein